MMTAEDLFLLFNDWKNATYLKDLSLCYDSVIYQKALDNFIFDYKRWYPNDGLVDRKKLLLTPQLHGILAYRVASLWFYSNIECGNGYSQQDLISNIGRINSLSELYYSAKIGLGFKINHGIGTIIGARSIIGNNCLFHQNVTLGDKNAGRPRLGDNCIVYAGASLLGDIKIGNNCIIGANSVVIDSFPDNSIIAGAPARLIRKI